MMAPDVQQFTSAPVATDVQARAERRLRAWLAALSPNTRDAYGNDLTLFAAHVGARDTSGVPSSGRAVCELITLAPSAALEVAENWQAHMIATGLGSATINRRMTALNTALRHLAKVGIGPGKLDLDQVAHEARREVEAASADVVARVVAELSASPSPDAIRDTAILLLAATRALRRSEIAALTLQGIDDAACAVRVKRKGNREKIWLAVDGTCRDALRRWLSIRQDHADTNAHAVFVALGNRGRGQGLSAQSIYNIVKARGGWHPHQLRHGAIEAVLRGSNNSLPLAQALAGHVDPASTMLYVGRAERRRLEAEAVGLMTGAFQLAEFKRYP